MDLSAYQVSAVRGFLPDRDPLQSLPDYFSPWERTAARLPALLMAGRLQAVLEQLPVLEVERLQPGRQQYRAALLLSVLGSAAVWGAGQPVLRIPRGIAMPLWQVTDRLGLPPIVCHFELALHNWRRLDAAQPVTLENVGPLQLFLGGLDEHWFYMVTVAIEAQGGPILQAILSAQDAARAGQAARLGVALEELATCLRTILALLGRMPEKCDPYIFFHRIRPYVAGWPEPGVIYEGVSEVPQIFSGGSAAQSPLIQAIDAGLGVVHEHPETDTFLSRMREYMLPDHRRFIEAIEQGQSIRAYVLAERAGFPELLDRYNTCLDILDSFRRMHIEISVRYILHQADPDSPATGTGGTNFVSFLSKARQETRDRRIAS